MKTTSGTKNASLQRMAAVAALLLVCTVSLATSGFVLSANANERKTGIVTFDVPGAQGTGAVAINPEGSITGNYSDSGGVLHGFVRTRHGTFVTFDVPGAGSGVDASPFGINPPGTTAGWWYDTIGLGHAHGFVRGPHGAIATFDAPGASQTWAFNINPAGTVAGYYNAGGVNAPDLFRGFVRGPKGAIMTFDAPGAGTGPGQGTFTGVTTGLNNAGAVTGYYLDANNVYHGFVRGPHGAIATFDVPGAGTGSGSFQGTFPVGINSEGAVTGGYVDANNVNHGFVRGPHGAITKFDVPGAGTGAFQGTQVELTSAISAAGRIVGVYLDASNTFHGFVRSPGGAITNLTVPGAGTGAFQGTIPLGSNPSGAIVGSYIDASNVSHGFLVEGE